MRPRVAIPRWRAPVWERTQHYRESLAAWGAEPVAVVEDDLPADIHGLLLTGGMDVNPRLYGERRGPCTERPHRRRDAHELHLLRQALERDLPVLAICRGHQLLNVALGGRLLQHVEGHSAGEDGASAWHPVRVVAKGRLAHACGGAREMPVNSRHHQAITLDRLAPFLTAVALSPDGLVEAVESDAHRWVVGVQWHPERPEMRPQSLSLFAAFVEACRQCGAMRGRECACG